MFAYAKPEQKRATKDIFQKKDAEKTTSSKDSKTHCENPWSFSFTGVSDSYKSNKPAQLQTHPNTQDDRYVEIKHKLNNVEPLQMKVSDKVVQLFKVEQTFTAIETGKNGSNDRAYSDIFGVSGTDVSKGNHKKVDNATNALAALGYTDNKCMGAHMLPKKLGGKGGMDCDNVKPWLASFETNIWNRVMEDDLNNKIREVKIGDELKYTVETTDMTDTEAQNVVANKKPNETPIFKDSCKNGIKPIPKNAVGAWEITGSVAGTGQVNSSACTPII